MDRCNFNFYRRKPLRPFYTNNISTKKNNKKEIKQKQKLIKGANNNE